MGRGASTSRAAELSGSASHQPFRERSGGLTTMKRRLRAASVFLCQRILLLGDGVLQSLAGLEEGGLLFRNGDGLEGLGVDALASLALLDTEGTESVSYTHLTLP